MPANITVSTMHMPLSFMDQNSVVTFAEGKGKNDPTIKIVIGATITVFFLSLLVIIVLLLLKILKKAPRRQEGTMRV